MKINGDKISISKEALSTLVQRLNSRHKTNEIETLVDTLIDIINDMHSSVRTSFKLSSVPHLADAIFANTDLFTKNFLRHIRILTAGEDKEINTEESYSTAKEFFNKANTYFQKGLMTYYFNENLYTQLPPPTDADYSPPGKNTDEAYIFFRFYIRIKGLSDFRLQFGVSQSDIIDNMNCPIYGTVIEFLIKKWNMDFTTDKIKALMEKREIAAAGIENRKLYRYTGWALKIISTGYYTDYQPEFLEKATLITEFLEFRGEDDYRHRGSSNGDNTVAQPTLLLMAFNFDTKSKYALIPEKLKPAVWEDDALERVVLPMKTKRLFNKLFYAKQETLEWDVIGGRSGGLVILCSGPSGTGKTLSAEAYCQIAHRPLYRLDIGELGVNLDKLEDNLMKIFRRVYIWNAMLLFDEVDIFFQKRNADIKHSAIVGVFLRVLDQFKGMLFLTTNRPEALDRAFESRITVHVKYEELKPEEKAIIFHTLISQAKLNVLNPEGISAISAKFRDGRHVRNVVRLAKIIYADAEVTMKQIESLIFDHSERFTTDDK